MGPVHYPEMFVNRLHWNTSQKTVLLKFIAVRTSNPVYWREILYEAIGYALLRYLTEISLYL
jgi:hypothetical protein